MGEFVKATTTDTIPTGGLAAFEVDGKRVAIANSGGQFYAFTDVCTHQQCPLSKGNLNGTTVTCPCHGSQFNIQNGEVENGPAEDPIATYSVRVADGVIEVEV